MDTAETTEKTSETAEKKTVKVSDNFYTRHGKRWLDVIIALLAMIVSSPILLLVIIITYFDVGRPVIFRQYRIGKGGKLFVIYKLRNMNNKTDENGILLPADQRVTKVGKFIRKTSADELPQLLNILKGDMSVIGPRPLLPHYLERYTEHDAYRHAIRPGLECPPLHPVDHQISWEEQFDNDVEYVEKCSFPLDVKLLLCLIKQVIKPSGYRESANRGSYREEEFGPINDFRGVNL